MNRRRFLRNSIAALGGAAIPQAPARAGRGKKIRPHYIREEIPPFEIPPYKGKW